MPIAFNYLDLIIYLIIISWRYIIRYKTPLKSLSKSIKEYKDILKYKTPLKSLSKSTKEYKDILKYKKSNRSL